MTRRTAAAVLVVATVVAGSWLVCPPLATAAIAQPDAEDVAIRTLVERIEQVAQRLDSAAYLALLDAAADRNATDQFLRDQFRSGVTHVVLQERERQHLAGTLASNTYSLTIDAFMEYGGRARVVTWQIDIRRAEDATWRITGQNVISSVENLYRLALNTKQQFDAKNFVVFSEDLELTLSEGTVFTVDTNQGTTGLVLMGRGEMRFHPAPRTEIEQVRIFGGADTLESRFDVAFVRVGKLATHADPSALVPRPVDPRDLRRAEQIFRDESVKSFVVDLADLSRDTWSLLPGPEDFLAEIRTRSFDALTYSRAMSEAEDISFFDRRRQRNIAVYASKDKLVARGRFYNEDDLSPFDVLHYDIDMTALPDRRFLDGNATMRIRVRAQSISQLTIRLADSLVVRSVNSNRFGRLFNLRVTNQNAILVNLPATLTRGAEMTLRIDYSGRLEPQRSERETIDFGQQGPGLSSTGDESTLQRVEPSFLYSNRSYWYPQPMVTDYATATIQLSIPTSYSCVASGEPTSDSPVLVGASSQARKVYSFTAERPLRYLAFLVSRLNRADRWTVAFEKDKSATTPADGAPAFGGAVYNKLDLIVDTNPRQSSSGRDLAERAVDVVQFYESIVGDSPYSSFTVALIENLLPGGHSPAYFAALNQPLAASNVTWRNDPAAFSSYPEFFLAHEIAHQWWGQAVGWRNYHEQWLSEGFAQYFAALYAQRFRGEAVFGSVMRQMGRWAAERSDQGAVYLGYRVGHIHDDGRAYRAIIYNKGAIVLHMLRQLIGDDVFFSALRRFYVESRFRKVGTDDFRRVMEAVSGRPLDLFFERWIYNSTLPKMAFSFRLEPSATGQDIVLRFEQTGEVFEMPVTVTLHYADRRAVDVRVPITDRIVEFRAPLEGTLRDAQINRDETFMAEIVKDP